ncbi:MAG: hypothetical protein M1813_005228 [Trichoglossum hirsutum]|nr:MAG: hypothetical protein M1813_005228 [Trichoglossum hirsutum]
MPRLNYKHSSPSTPSAMSEETPRQLPRIGLLYLLPADTELATDAYPISLNEILNDDITRDHTADLGLLATSWLHKGIRSHDVLFFSTGLTQPRLAGFDNSRPDHPAEVSVRVAKSNRTFDSYRHPEYYSTQTTRWKKFDIFSLGVVLMEVAFWGAAGELHGMWLGRPPTDRDELAGFWGALKGRFVEMLGARVGAAYKEAVKACLVGIGSVEEDKLIGWFGEEAVGRLEGCSV